MAFHLTVAGSLEPLADVLAGELAVPPSDPFTAEVVVVPGDGVKTWLTARLAQRLGSTARGVDGIAANIDFLFPANLVRRVVGTDTGIGAWSVGPLTWAIYEVLVDRGAELGQSADAVRARAIADLFDRYTLYRQAMVRRWSDGADVNARGDRLDEHQQWQPKLWRAVQEHLGGPSDAQRMAEFTTALRSGSVAESVFAEVPERVFLFGLASLPSPQLEVLAGLAAHRDVHVLAPTASAARWHQVRDQLRSPLRLPALRTDEEVPVGHGHRLVTSWGRTSREANLLLIASADEVRGAIVTPPDQPDEPGEGATVLSRLQYGLRADLDPPGAPSPGGTDESTEPDQRPELDPSDTSIRWHRTYGPARQVEVLRDSLLHLLEEKNNDGSARFEPRDITVLCTDPGRFAPLIEATFAGDPNNGVPQLPVQIADRSLRQDNAILDAATGLLDLIDGRFRASSVLALASRSPVRYRFGLDGDALGRISEWAENTNVRWGLDAQDQTRFGLPEALAGVHTWRAGLDQLLVGATMAAAGPRLGPGDVVPFADIEGSDVAIAGSLAELIHQLDIAITALRTPSSVDGWCAALSAALGSLCAVSDTDSWQWRTVERAIEDFRSEATVDDVPRDMIVEPADLAALLRGRLVGGAGRPRFGTGSITVSSLTAQRGVPHRVICLLGLDDDVSAGALAAAEDLLVAEPCVGDRDPRSEQRAQLLDAVLAAGERLLVFTTGHNIRSNAEVPPVVALAELFDVIDATVRLPGDASDPASPARSALIVDHPRQGWSEPGFVAGELGLDGPWSFDSGALEAATARRAQDEEPPFLADALEPPLVEHAATGTPFIALADLVDVCSKSTRTFLRSRLGISLVEEDDAIADQIELRPDSLDQWKLAQALLTARLDADDETDPALETTWAKTERRCGAVPPLAFGDEVLEDVTHRVDGLLDALRVELDGQPYDPASIPIEFTTLDSDGSEVVVEGAVAGVSGDTVVMITPSRLKAKHVLDAWIYLGALTVQDPERKWKSITLGRAASGEKLAVQRMTLRSADAGDEVMAVALDLHRRALCDAIPAFPETTKAIYADDLSKARNAWSSMFGEHARDQWISFVFPEDFDAIRDLPVRPDELIDGVPASSRLAYWADRIWGTLERTADVEERKPNAGSAVGSGSDA